MHVIEAVEQDCKEHRDPPIETEFKAHSDENPDPDMLTMEPGVPNEGTTDSMRGPLSVHNWHGTASPSQVAATSSTDNHVFIAFQH